MKTLQLRVIAMTMFVVLSLFARAQQPYPQENLWTTTFPGKSLGGNTVGIKSVQDATGNMFVTGNYSGQPIFSSVSLPMSTTPTSYIIKYSPTGTLLWAKTFSGEGSVADISVTGSNVTVIGRFSQTMNFNPSGAPSMKTSTGGVDLYIASFNATSGAFQWVKTFGGTGDDGIMSFATDGTSAYVMGTTQASIEFNPEGPSLIATSPGGVMGYYAKCNLTNGNFSWVKTLLNSGGGLDVAVTTNGLYITGVFNGINDFGNGFVLDASTTQSDVFIAKVDPSNGSTVWAKRVGGNSQDRSLSIAANSTDVYVLGTFVGLATFTNGVVLSGQVGNHVFVARFNEATSDVVWVKQAGPNAPAPPPAPPAPPGFIAPTDLALSSTFVTVCGLYNQSINFNVTGPAITRTSQAMGSTFLTSYNITDPAAPPLVRELTASIAVRSITSTDTQFLLTGIFFGTANFDTSTPGIQATAIANDAFLSRYNASNSTANFVATGGSPFVAEDFGGKVKLDGAGNVYVTGNFASQDFAMGATHLLNKGGVDAFIAKLTTSGTPVWIKHIGGAGNDYIQDITVTPTHLYITGHFSQTIDLNVGSTAALRTSTGGSDVFVSQLDVATGNLIWGKSFGGPGDDVGNAVFLDASGVFVGGSFTSAANFNDVATPANLTSAGLSDSFIAKYNLNTGAYMWAVREGGVDNDAVNDLVSDPSYVYATGQTYAGFNGKMFLGKYSSTSGTQQYLKINSTSGSGFATGIAIGLRTPGVLVVAGYYAYGIGFPSKMGDVPMISNGSSYDVFRADVDATDGNAFTPPVTFGGTGQETLGDMAVVGPDTYLTGKFTTTVPGPSPIGLSNPSGINTCFVLRYQGPALSYATKQSGSAETFGTGIAADNAAVYLTGTFRTLLYLPSTSITQSSAGAADIFVAKFDAKLKQTVTYNPPSTPLYCSQPALNLLNATSDSNLPVSYTSSDNTIININGPVVIPLKSGTVTITAIQPGSSAFSAATPVARTFVVNKSAQTLSFTPPSTKNYGEAPFALVASSSAALPVTFASTNEAVATVSGSTATIVAPGTGGFTASQAGDACYSAATPVTRTFTVLKNNPVITFTSANTGTYYSTIPLTVDKGGSTGAVTYTYTSGPGFAIVSGSNLQLRNVGNVTITATVAADAFYNSATGTQVIEIKKAPLTVSADNKTKAYGQVNPSLTLTYTGFRGTDNNSLFTTAPVPTTTAATCSSPASYDITVTPGNALNNYDVTYTTGTLAVTTAAITVTAPSPSRAYGTPNPALNVTYTIPCGDDFNILPTASTAANQTSPVGVYDVNVVAGTDPNYSTIPVTGQLTIYKADQTISFGTLPSKTVVDAPFTLSATASSGLSPTYTSSNSSVATVSGSTVTIVGAGTTTITASQTGNGNYNTAISVTQPLVVNKLNQTISFGSLAAKTYGDASFALTATASSGLAVTFTSSNAGVATVNGSTVTIVGAGSTTITASQDGNGTFNAAQGVAQTLQITKRAQTITFTPLSPRNVGDPQFPSNATSSSALTVTLSSDNTSVATISGTMINVIGAGTATITASQPGNSNYESAASVQQTFTVNRLNQTVSFSTIPTFTYGNGSYTMSASASSGLGVTFSSNNTGVVSVSGNTLYINGAGTATVTASQAGNSSYNPASTSQTVTVNRAGQTISFGPLSNMCVNTNKPVSATASSGLPVSYSSSNSSIAFEYAGSIYSSGEGTAYITASQSGNANYLPATSVSQAQVVASVSASISYGSPVFCPVGYVRLTANSGSGYSYQWENNGVAISGATGIIYDATANGLYTVVVTNNNASGCSKRSSPVNVGNGQAIVTIVPGSQTICPGTIAEMTASWTEIQCTYQWKRNGSAISGATNNWYNTKLGGTYTLTTTSVWGCVYTSPPVTITTSTSACNDPCSSSISVNGSVKKNGGANNIIPCNSIVASEATVYPNPVEKMMTIQLPTGTERALPVNVYNQLGTLVTTATIKAGDSDVIIDTSQLTNGFYNVRIDDAHNGKVTTRRVLVNH